MPPARCSPRRGTCRWRGATLQMHGTRRDTASISASPKSTPASGGGEQVQDRVGRAAHRDVERHRVLERVAGRDAPRQHGLVVVVVVARVQRPRRAPASSYSAARGVGGEHRAVAGQREPDRLGEAVHRVGGEHAGAGAAGRAGALLDPQRCPRRRRRRRRRRMIASMRSSLRTAVDQRGPAGLHRAAGDEHGRDVQPQRGEQHARRDLVAVGDADQRVGAVRVDHVLDRVGDQLAATAASRACRVAHRDAVVDGDGVELAGHAARRADRAGDDLADLARWAWPGTNWVKLLATAMIGLPKSARLTPGPA